MKEVLIIVRIRLVLRASKNFVYDDKYFHKAQGFIYSLLRSSLLEDLHNKKHYKFFCFSRIEPYKKYVNLNDTFEWIISSPLQLFIETCLEKLEAIKNSGLEIEIGEMSFYIDEISLDEIKLSRNFSLTSRTPIIIRIPENKYDYYSIPQKFRKKRYVFWRPMYSLNAFVESLQQNMINKYNLFYNKNINIPRIFQSVEIRKLDPIVNYVVVNGKEQMFIGTLWNFHFKNVDEEVRKLVEFNIDCGFGERNSYGFGFMDVIRR